MGIRVPPKGLTPVILADTSSHSFSICRLPIYTSSTCPFSRGKPHISLQISSGRIKQIISACSNDSGLYENYSPSEKSPSSKEVSFDVKLPRRNMIVQFTCNSCGERTQRKISRRAYEGGTVFVQDIFIPRASHKRRAYRSDTSMHDYSTKEFVCDAGRSYVMAFLKVPTVKPILPKEDVLTKREMRLKKEQERLKEETA